MGSLDARGIARLGWAAAIPHLLVLITDDLLIIVSTDAANPRTRGSLGHIRWFSLGGRSCRTGCGRSGFGIGSRIGRGSARGRRRFSRRGCRRFGRRSCRFGLFGLRREAVEAESRDQQNHCGETQKSGNSEHMILSFMVRYVICRVQARRHRLFHRARVKRANTVNSGGNGMNEGTLLLWRGRRLINP